MIRFAVENNRGDAYLWREDEKDWIDDNNNLCVEFGEWYAPFPNEKGNSFAFGIVEAFWQSDSVPNTWWDWQGTEIIRVKCERV